MSAKNTKGDKVDKKATGGAKKSATKTEKTEKKPVEKKVKKQAPAESVGFVYGGTMKASYGYLFCASVSTPEDVKAHAKEHFAEYYGNDFSGRFVKCENGEEALEKVIEQAEVKDYRVGTEGKLLSASVNNLAALLKEVTGSASAHNFSMDEKKKKEKEKETKKKVNKGDDEDEEGEDEEGEDEDVDGDEEGDEDTEGDAEAEEEEEEEEEEEPVKKPEKSTKKPVTKKPVVVKKPPVKPPKKN